MSSRVSIVSDTTTLIILGKLDRYDLLNNIFEKIFIPHAVLNEVLQKEDGIHRKIREHPLFETKTIIDTKLLTVLSGLLDAGECEAIVLAKELDKILLIDEKKGRTIAKNMGLEIIGLIGVLILNVKKVYISNQEAKELLNQIKALKFRVSSALENQFLMVIDDG